MYIELQRTFRELLRNEEQGDNAGALSPGTSKLTLPDLLNEFRVIILSEAGSGKTEEIRESARRLRAEGKAAFFLRLEHVFFDFDTAFEEGTLEEFQAWLTSSEQGWVLLDSIDESRIRSPQDFAVAMRKVSARLATAKQRTHLLITGRTPAWRPKSDLDLCSMLFPVATWPTGAPDEDAGTAGEHKKTISVTGTTPFKIVALDDLSTQQVKHFAEEKGVGDTQLFLDAIERADAWSFTARPQDLDELTGFWLDNGTIGSRLELMTNSISRRLKEPDQTRAEVLSLLAERALEGAQIIAATLMLTNQQTIQIAPPREMRRYRHSFDCHWNIQTDLIIFVAYKVHSSVRNEIFRNVPECIEKYVVVPVVEVRCNRLAATIEPFKEGKKPVIL